MEENPTSVSTEENQIDAGTYEILKQRLNNSGQILQTRLDKLNEVRKDTFGNIPTALLKTERISTENNCIPRDMIAVGELFIFGYNVHIGLKLEVELADVFSVYAFDSANQVFEHRDLTLLSDERFLEDFRQLYKYYKHTTFAKFVVIGPHLYLKFHTAKDATGIKAFKFLIEQDKLRYIDNRSDHEIQFPAQHDFEWKRASRDFHREGEHPHISILDKVFVETIGGDLTIKVEDNTDSGEGIYAEEVEQKEQTLDDAEIYFADLGNLILLKIKPYLENDSRYFVFNYKLSEVHRVDSIKDACVLLPDEQGIIFSEGYYLQTGELKVYENNLTDMRFEIKNVSPNGEDFMYIFYSSQLGDYVLFSYNRIAQQVESPIVCSGFSFFKNGELIYFKADHEPKKHHGLQLWQTPYVHPDYEVSVHDESYLYKVGNKDIVKAMAECNELLKLIHKEEAYNTVYQDIAKKSSEVADSYYWIDHEEAFDLKGTLLEIHEHAVVAIEEFEKVTRLRRTTKETTANVIADVEKVTEEIKRRPYKDIHAFVETLTFLRKTRGETVALKELRYVNLEEVARLEIHLKEQNDIISNKCVSFLLQENSLAPYQENVLAQDKKIEGISKVAEANKVHEENLKIGDELEMLIEIVSNLKIDDATHTTAIIEHISDIYASLNQVKVKLKQKKKSLLGTEAKAEFSAQIRLVSQSIVNYLDISDTPEQCEEYMTKLMVQLEELEGRFSEFDELLPTLIDKREELYQAFESKKLQLVEKRNKRTNAIYSAAERILKSIDHKLKGFKDVNEIHAYFAADIMVHKVQEIIGQLQELEDVVKADDIQSKLNATKEEAVRQLKDRKDLLDEGENVIKFGKHRFSVNIQSLDVSLVKKEGEFFFHLSGTNFFEKAILPSTYNTTILDQELVSENTEVYRAEYLAFQFFNYLKENNLIKSNKAIKSSELEGQLQSFMASKYQEGYQKGIHDVDAALILKQLIAFENNLGLIKYTPTARAFAALWWQVLADKSVKETLSNRIKSQALIWHIFPENNEQTALEQDIVEEMLQSGQKLFNKVIFREAATYLIHELAKDQNFVTSNKAATIHQGFKKYLKSQKSEEAYLDSIKVLQSSSLICYELIKDWLVAYIKQEENKFGQTAIEDLQGYIEEAAVLLLTNTYKKANVLSVEDEINISGLVGEHNSIEEGSYKMNYHQFIYNLNYFSTNTVPAFQALQNQKKSLIEAFRNEIRLEEFKPRVLSSFVRNRLVDEVYLPLVGDNLAKQIGVVGQNKRTDLMGMLLLVSPPGYGKTTLMEYIANRVGLIFMKINGPAIGHNVTALDPKEAGNASAAEELKKLNLAFEMGDNVMIYLDDIQHCNPEFLQKFISLCDGQRKIEGVYKGKPKTYDLRGKRVCVVMAGNPYTESGEKFRIPDMLANRADTYNLGDIIGGIDEQFKLSYIENALTSNSVLSKLAVKSQKDIHSIIRFAETQNRELLDFEGNIAADELNEYVNVLQKLLKIRDIILQVNLKYIESAAQADEYRTTPPFKLQGSYRNMNKLAEKVMPVMNDEELQTMLLAHYENESQTLTSDAEANLLAFNQIMGLMTDIQKSRWEEIIGIFQKKQRQKGYGQNNQMVALLEKLNVFTKNLEGIKEAIENK